MKPEPKKEQVKVEEPKAPIKEIVVNRVIEKEEDWDVAAPARKGKGNRTAKIGQRKVARVMQKGPARWKVQFTDGTIDWIAKKDVK